MYIYERQGVIRGYDAALGRFMQVDALATRTSDLSPYHYARNNPVVFNDPTGLYTPADYNSIRDAVNKGFVEEFTPPGGSRRDRKNAIRQNFSMKGYMYSSIMPGSGNSWADGINNVDWTATGGSSSYRAVVVAGAKNWGGKQYMLDGRNWYEVVYKNGVAGYYVPYNDGPVESVSGLNLRDTKVIEDMVVISHKFIAIGQTGSGPGWFDDPQGEFFFDHWRNGNGQELNLNSAEWSRYMRSNAYLANVSIASHLYSLGIKNSGWISGSFHGETGQSGWRSGHEMLNGSNSFVGDLQYSGYAHVNSDGSMSYLLNFTWNDIMDPNSNHVGDTIGAALFPGTPHNVHIFWTDLITITPK